MLGEKKIREIIEKGLASSHSEETEVSVFAWNYGLTRFANSYIHQNVEEKRLSISVRCISDKRVGEAVTSRRDGIPACVLNAEEIARIQKPNPDWVSLPEPELVGTGLVPVHQFIPTYFDSTVELDEHKRARACKVIIDKATGFNAYGSFGRSILEIGIGNSKELFVYNAGTSASLITIIMGDGISGYGKFCSRDATQINSEEIAERALSKLRTNKAPISLSPGEYEVVLEPFAVSALPLWLGYLGFGALAYQEGRSFMSDKLGEKVMGDNVTIWDDGFNPAGICFPFDFEGVRKKKVMLIENGIAKGVVYDSTTAAKEGKKSTGHSVRDTIYGPLPFHLFMKGGDSTTNELVKSTKKGVYVTRFHYINPVDHKQAVITGMTRDGTFLIENGEITHPLKDLRFTMGIPKALSGISLLTPPVLVGEIEPYSGFPIGVVAPALKLNRWNFTGVSE